MRNAGKAWLRQMYLGGGIMKKGTIIIVSVSVVLLILVAGFVNVAVGLAGEGGKLDGQLKQDLTAHAAIADVKNQLTSEQYTFKESLTGLSATGPVHGFLGYQSSLVLNLTFDSDGQMTAYHMDRS